MKHWFAIVCTFLALNAWAQSNLEINTPAIAAIRAVMKERFEQLTPHLDSGAVGRANDGSLVVRDVSLVPLAQRGVINNLVNASNQDRLALYREIAKANGHPEWENDIARTFAARWIEKARPGWWVQDATGAWKKK